MNKTNQRLNAGLTGLLLVALVWLINGFARDHLDIKRDLSEDQLFASSPELAARLEALDDLLVVTAYLTASPEHGAVQIAKSRLVSQLKDFEEAAGGRMRLEFVDPNSSSEAKLEAVRLGIRPFASSGSAARGSIGAQEVWMGIGLGYRGRERALPVVMPQTLEYAFAAELFRLVRDRVPRIGWFAPAAGGDEAWTFRQARATLQLAGEVVDIEHLAVADALPANLDLLVVVRPVTLHPRAAYTIERFVQSGGRVLIAFDNHRYALDQNQPGSHLVTGLESLLASWGIAPSAGIVWDQACVAINARRTVDGEVVSSSQVPYPHWLDIAPASLSSELPVTARLSGLQLFWAQALGVSSEAEAARAGGLERLDIVHSSERSWLLDPPGSLVVDPTLVDTQSAELAGTSEGQPLPLVSVLSGSFPTAFARDGSYGGVPVALDLFQAVLGETTWDGSLTDELAEAGGEPGHAVVIGDSDWLADQDLSPVEGQLAEAFLANLVDWLLLEEDLVALRSRIPRDRPITDFLAEERAARGVTDLSAVVNLDEAETRTRAVDEAQAAAGKRRMGVMLRATGGSFLAALLLVGLPGWLRSRRRSLFGEDPEDPGSTA